MSDQHSEQAGARRRGPEAPDISERGGLKNGQPQRSDERLFMQLLVFGGCLDARALALNLAAQLLRSVIGAVFLEEAQHRAEQHNRQNNHRVCPILQKC